MVQSLMACLSIAVVLLLGVAITTENGKRLLNMGPQETSSNQTQAMEFII